MTRKPRDAAVVAATNGRLAVDCDVHVAPPGVSALVPWLDDYWREMVCVRALDRLDLTLTSAPERTPLSCRPDWRPAKGRPASSPAMVRSAVLDGLGSDLAILNCLHGAVALHSEDMAAALCRALNDWIAAEWLDAEPRFRASIVVPAQSPRLAAEEIERRAADTRFVQVLMLLMQETTLGRRHLWPIYEAAERHGLPVGIHAGGIYRYAATSVGWSSSYLEDYVAQSTGFEGQLMSLLAEGVFQKFPALKVVLIESGVSWLPGFLWRADKVWRGVRAEVPWLTEPPSDIVRRQVRLTAQPLDLREQSAAELEALIARIGSNETLLFASDYPHWHFDGTAALPADLSPALRHKLAVENPAATYPRLAAAAKDAVRKKPAHKKEIAR